MTPEYFELLQSGASAEAHFIREVTRGYEAFHLDRIGVRGVYAHDPAAAVCALGDGAFTFRKGAVRVVHDGFAAGLTLQNASPRAFPPNGWDGVPQQDVAIEVDAARVLELFAMPFL